MSAPFDRPVRVIQPKLGWEGTTFAVDGATRIVLPYGSLWTPERRGDALVLVPDEAKRPVR